MADSFLAGNYGVRHGPGFNPGHAKKKKKKDKLEKVHLRSFVNKPVPCSLGSLVALSPPSNLGTGVSISFFILEIKKKTLQGASF